MKVAYVTNVPDYIRNIYTENAFMHDFFKISIDEIHCGSATVSIKIEGDKHLNHRHVVHGGVMTALADSVLGVTGASVGKQVVTLSFNMNFIRNIEQNDTMRVISSIKHNGRKTMVIEAKLFDSQDRLMATVLTTMFIVGTFEEIPEKW